MRCVAASTTRTLQTTQWLTLCDPNGIGDVSIKTKLIKSGIKVFKGNPTMALSEPALFIGITARARGGFADNVVASLSSVRPAIGGYSVKELIADMELGPQAAMEKAIDIAIRGEIRMIFINADIDKLPSEVPQSA